MSSLGHFIDFAILVYLEHALAFVPKLNHPLFSHLGD